MNWPLKSKPVKRNGCFDGCVLLLVGAIAAAVALPSFLTVKSSHPIEDVKMALAGSAKECAVLTARKEKNLIINLTYLQRFAPRYLDWQIVDLESRSRLDPDQDCNEAHLLAVPTEKIWKKLAFGLSLQNYQKSCVTRDGEKRDDWSCE